MNQTVERRRVSLFIDAAHDSEDVYGRCGAWEISFERCYDGFCTVKIHAIIPLSFLQIDQTLHEGKTKRLAKKVYIVRPFNLGPGLLNVS